GNGNHVGRNECRNVTGLRFNDGQRGQRTGTTLHFAVGELFNVLFVYTGSALEQTGVEIEHVTGVGFAAGRTTQQQRHLTIGPGLLGQVVVNDEGVFTAIAEVFAHRAAGVGSDVLHGSRLGSRGGHDNGVFECAVLFELANDVGNGRSLLADSNVDAGDTLALLGNDGVDGDGGLTGLAVANDQLALTTTHRDHGVDGLGTSLQRLRHRLTGNHARSNLLDNIGQLGIDRTLA